MAPSCRSFPCKICKKRHNFLLHLKEVDKIKQTNTETEDSQNINYENSDEPSGSKQAHSLSMTSVMICLNSYVFLSTAMVDILDHKNNPIRSRALLDSGS